MNFEETQKEALEKQINLNMKKAFSNLLREICSKDKLDAKDIDWILSLCVELKDRINRLTPRRTDLHKELERSFDIGLIKQMLEYNVLEMNDLPSIIDILEFRIENLCAPIQDEHVKKTFSRIRSSKKIAETVELIILELNKILDVIYSLNTQFTTQHSE